MKCSEGSQIIIHGFELSQRTFQLTNIENSRLKILCYIGLEGKEVMLHMYRLYFVYEGLMLLLKGTE